MPRVHITFKEVASERTGTFFALAAEIQTFSHAEALLGRWPRPLSHLRSGPYDFSHVSRSNVYTCEGHIQLFMSDYYFVLCLAMRLSANRFHDASTYQENSSG